MHSFEDLVQLGFDSKQAMILLEYATLHAKEVFDTFQTLVSNATIKPDTITDISLETTKANSSSLLLLAMILISLGYIMNPSSKKGTNNNDWSADDNEWGADNDNTIDHKDG